MSAFERAAELDENLAEVNQLTGDAQVGGEVADEIDPAVERIVSKRSLGSLEIVAFGTVSSGKSSLLNALAGRDVFASDARGGTTVHRNEIPWPGAERVTLVDTPGLGEVDGEARQHVSAQAAQNADIILLVVDGPLRASEFRLLAELKQMDKPILVCLNKDDLYSEAEKGRLLGQINEQVKDVAAAGAALAVRSNGGVRKRVRVTAGGETIEETVELAPDIAPLAERMLDVVKKDGTDLLLSNLLLQSRGLVEETRARLRQAIDRKAWKLVEKYTWGAGGVAALSPLPVVDLIAGCAISSKMVLDLAKVYRQDVDVDVAVKLLGQLGKNLLGILGAAAATPALAAFVASLLKTIPGIGTLAGGALQGVVMALITRWIGAVFIEYFLGEMQAPEGGLSDIARRKWRELTRPQALRALVNEARRRGAVRDADA